MDTHSTWMLPLDCAGRLMARLTGYRNERMVFLSFFPRGNPHILPREHSAVCSLVSIRIWMGWQPENGIPTNQTTSQLCAVMVRQEGKRVNIRVAHYQKGNWCASESIAIDHTMHSSLSPVDRPIRSRGCQW